MKHRSVMSVILLSIVTVGIYDLYWLVKVKKELNARTSVHTPTIWLLFLPILVLIPLVVLVAIVSSANANSSSAAGVGASALLILVEFLAILAFIPITFYWFFKFSKAVSEYTHGELSTAMNFILLWLLRFIGMAIIQDKFNDMLAAGTSGGSAPAPAGMPYNPVQQQPTDPNAGMPTPQGPSDPGTQPPVQPTPPTNPIG